MGVVRGLILVGVLLGSGGRGWDVRVDISPEAVRSGHTTSRRVLGCHSDSGYTKQVATLSPELVWGSSFEGNNVNVAKGQSFEPSLPFNTTWPNAMGDCNTTIHGDSFHGMASLLIQPSGGGLCGRSNRGVANMGLALRKGAAYTGYLFAKGTGPVTVQLRDYTTGAVLARGGGTAVPGSWSRINYTLTPSASTSCKEVSSTDHPLDPCYGTYAQKMCLRCGGELVVMAEAGPVNIDYVTLRPVDATYRGAVVNPDAVRVLQQMGVSAIRAGGSFAESDWYLWKYWRGVPWERPSRGSVWGAAVVEGWGPIEIIEMCEAAGIEPILTTQAESTHHPGSCCTAEDMSDLVEYAWGNLSTAWGKTRISDGRRLPYHLYLYELGNEQYNSRFVDQVLAMHRRAQRVAPPGELHKFRYFFPAPYFMNFTYLNDTDGARMEAAGLGAKVVNDVHEDPGKDAVAKLEWQFAQHPGWTFGGANLETNKYTHDMARGVSEAQDINEMLSTFIPAVGTNASRIEFRAASFCTGWWGWPDTNSQELASYLPNMSFWLQPPGWVHSMIASTWEDVSLPTSAPLRNLSAQGTVTGNALRVRVVATNPSPAPLALNITWWGAQGLPSSLALTTLSHPEPSTRNTPGSPLLIAPRTSRQPPGSVTLPPHSVTVVQGTFPFPGK